jgi:phosphoribosylformylglycinamidine synthase PurS subunit
LPDFRFAVAVMPKAGILDPQGRAVEQSLGHIPDVPAQSVREVRVGRRVELTVQASAEAEARAVAGRLAEELLSNPLIETWSLERLA